MLSVKTRGRFNTLLDAITLTAADDDPAIILVSSTDDPVVVTRHAFSRQVQNTANSMSALGIRPRDLVVIAHTQDLESIYSFWGALAIGAIPSMFPTLTDKLDPDIYMHNMAELVQLSGVAAVLTTDEFAPHLRNHLSCAVFSSTELANHLTERDSAGDYQSRPEEIAFLQHSSGTTGLQKGVALSHRAVLNQIAAYSDAIHLAHDDIIVSWLPLYHDMGLIAGFLLPIIQGVPLVLMSPFDWVSHPALLLKAIHDHRGTLCWLPNFAYNHCAHRIRHRDSEGLSIASMRMFINCSEPVYHESHQLFLERFSENGARPEQLAVSYAMAENTFAVTQTSPGVPPRLDVVEGPRLETDRYAKQISEDDPNAQIRVSCGPPTPGTLIRIIAEDGHLLPDRNVGEIAIQSDYLLSSYYKRPDIEPFVDGWFMTGDMGYLADGELFVVGRRKDLIINAGKNIYPADIEAIINQVTGVRPGRAVVFGVANEREGTELVAAVAEVVTEDEEERRDIGRAIRQAVVRQSSVTLNYIHLVGSKWLLKTSSGKIARGANRDKWLREKSGNP